MARGKKKETSYKVTDEDRKGGYKTAPGGTYAIRVTDKSKMVAGRGGDSQINLHAVIREGEHKGVSFFDRIAGHVGFKLAQLESAFGEPKKQTLEALLKHVMKVGDARVILRETEYQGRRQNKVVTWLPDGESEEEDWDEDDEWDDEDSDESDESDEDDEEDDDWDDDEEEDEDEDEDEDEWDDEDDEDDDEEDEEDEEDLDDDDDEDEDEDEDEDDEDWEDDEDEEEEEPEPEPEPKKKRSRKSKKAPAKKKTSARKSSKASKKTTRSRKKKK